VQAAAVKDNMDTLQVSYTVIFKFFTKLGLALEYDKSELFYFDCAHKPTNPSLDLGYALYTGNTLLIPKTYWRYLGFFFDCKLTFNEHVCFYSTKVLTSVKAMHMLDNSSCGLLPKNRRTLYWLCVIPIATYGFCLWYFNSSKSKQANKTLNKMQRQAALWITGVFCTSPTGGVKACAGLLPIILIFKKLSSGSIT
jgi:hypothetical protein